MMGFFYNYAIYLQPSMLRKNNHLKDKPKNRDPREGGVKINEFVFTFSLICLTPRRCSVTGESMAVSSFKLLVRDLN